VREREKKGGHGGDGAAPFYRGGTVERELGVAGSGATRREEERGLPVAHGERGV
jgi:hypothetical protein